MVKKEFHTPHGVEVRDCTPKEEARFRAQNDRDFLKEDYKKAVTSADKITIIAKLLGLD